jgi:hypothetical protein
MHAPSSAALSARLVWARVARPTTVPGTAVQWPWCCHETYAWVFGRAGGRAVTTSYTTGWTQLLGVSYFPDIQCRALGEP